MSSLSQNIFFSCNVAAVTWGSERRGRVWDVFSPAPCRRGRSFERRRLHHSHLPGAICLQAKRYKLMVIMQLRPSLVLRWHHKGPCENNDSVADLKGGKSEPSTRCFKSAGVRHKLAGTRRGGWLRQSPLSQTSGSVCSCLRCVFCTTRRRTHEDQSERGLVRNGDMCRKKTIEHVAGFCHRPPRSLFFSLTLTLNTCPPLAHVHVRLFSFTGQCSHMKDTPTNLNWRTLEVRRGWSGDEGGFGNSLCQRCKFNQMSWWFVGS